MQSLQESCKLHEARAESLDRQLAASARQLEQAGKEQAALESKLAAAQFSKPAIVPLSQVCLTVCMSWTMTTTVVLPVGAQPVGASRQRAGSAGEQAGGCSVLQACHHAPVTGVLHGCHET